MDQEIQRLQAKILQTKLPFELRQKVERWLLRLKNLNNSQGDSLREVEIISKYLDWVLKIPFGYETEDNLDLQNAKTVLNNGHYGLDSVKEVILEHIATRKLRLNAENNNQNIPNPVLCFIGVQGVGKTTMAKSIAKALGKNFDSIPLGAFTNVNEIRGLNKAEIGAEPGQIIKSLIRTKAMNSVILLDEIDKISETNNVRADTMAALLEILDPSQNSTFTDRYVDSPIDLSRVFFIATANNISGLSAALVDRLELVRFSSYNDQEKIMITKNYLLPKIRNQMGLSEKQLQFSDDVWELMVRPQGMDPGIRGLERNLRQVARKVAKKIVSNELQTVQITSQNFREYIPETIEIYT